MAAVPAMASGTWSLDFENGFTASSGTAFVNYGDLANPGNTAQEVHVEADPVRTNNTALDIDMINTTTPRSLLAYTGTDFIPTYQSGTLDVEYYQYLDAYNRSAMLFTMTDGTPSVAGDEYIGFSIVKTTAGGWGLATLAYDNLNGTMVLTNTTYAAPASLFTAGGWHSISFTWESIGYSETLGRNAAVINAWIDEIQVAENVTVGWAQFDTSMLTVGCRWLGSGTNGASQLDGNERGDLMDNLVVTPEPATALLLLIGSTVLFRKKK
ncbi:MAG: PEP-CTERM sorting domain-containing protein [Planctomycetaceae bacterium]|nr:PEP-CTERM sorting domain-containing protein [Planctomycetaceae bacterium]